MKVDWKELIHRQAVGRVIWSLGAPSCRRYWWITPAGLFPAACKRYKLRRIIKLHLNWFLLRNLMAQITPCVVFLFMVLLVKYVKMFNHHPWVVQLVCRKSVQCRIGRTGQQCIASIKTRFPNNIATVRKLDAALLFQWYCVIHIGRTGQQCIASMNTRFPNNIATVHKLDAPLLCQWYCVIHIGRTGQQCIASINTRFPNSIATVRKLDVALLCQWYCVIHIPFGAPYFLAGWTVWIEWLSGDFKEAYSAIHVANN
jgi:hypothetical protein